MLITIVIKYKCEPLIHVLISSRYFLESYPSINYHFDKY